MYVNVWSSLFRRLGFNQYGCQSCPRLSPFEPENLVSLDRCGRLVPRRSVHSPHPGSIWCLLLLTCSSPSSRFPRRRPSMPSTAIGSIPRLSGHAIAYRWRAPSVRRHKASSPQGGSCNWRCRFRLYKGPVNMRPLVLYSH